MKLILASASPRRLELLQALGLVVLVVPADIDESPHPAESAEAMVLRLAVCKAQAVADRYVDDLIIAGDTTVLLNGIVLGKPVDAPDACSMLKGLQGAWHKVFSATAVISKAHDLFESFCSTTEVKFVPMSDSEIAKYVATGEPMDKAGAYGIQGIGAQYVEEIRGSYTNVVGLDLARLMHILRPLGF